MIVTYPLGLAHVQEMVPWHLSSHEDVLRLGYQTTSLFCAATTSLCLLYIVSYGTRYAPVTSSSHCMTMCYTGLGLLDT